MERDAGDTSKRKGKEAHQEKEHRAKRLKGTIGQDAFSCDACTQLLKPPIQCSGGHYFVCSSCHINQPKCQTCAGRSSLERSYGMERAVRSVLVDCCYANHGCRGKTTFSDKGSHEKACPHATCFCPYPGCGFAGQAAEFLRHLTAHHRCPCTEFTYMVQFNLRVVDPGVHVLRCEEDGQLILLHAQQLERPRGYAISMVCVLRPCDKEVGIGCSVSFSCSSNRSGTSRLHILRSSLTDCAPAPTDYICFVPKVSDGPEDAGVTLRAKVVFADTAAEDGDLELETLRASTSNIFGDTSYEFLNALQFLFPATCGTEQEGGV